MKKVFKIFSIILVVLLIILLVLYFIFKSSDNYYIGKWYYKYTYLSNDKLHYTEEDDMESYIILKKNNTYISGDYCSDIVEKGFFIETNKGIYLINDDTWLFKYDNDKLKTSIKNGKEVLFEHDFYNVLIKK